MTIRTRLSIPSVKNSTWKVHDQNLAILLEHPGSNQELNDQVATFQDTIYTYFDEHYPQHPSYAQKNKENSFKLKMRRKKRELIKNLRVAKAMGDNNLSHQLSRALRSILKLIQGISLQITKNSEKFNRAKHEATFDKNPFEYSKHIFKEQKGKILLTDQQIYDHYRETYEIPKVVQPYGDPNTKKPINPLVEFEMSPPKIEEIEYQIKKKSSKAAPGPDGIPYIVYKKCPSVRKHLVKIYNKIWSRKEIPVAFGEAAFVLIPKKDVVTNPKDTRPIALTNTISKIFFSLLQFKISNFMIKNSYFRPNHQKGFLPGISGCLEHNTLVAESLKDARTFERQITVCWIDLENAFGSVQHELMTFAMRWYNFPTQIINIITSYYSNLKFKITTKEGYTGPLKYNVGLFQGCCLSPIVFNVVINILIDKLISNEKKWGYRFKINNKYTEYILAFADDLAVLTRNPKQCQDLLRLVDEFCSWTNGMKTKPAKCHCLCLGRRDTKFTSYDPGIEIGGQRVATIAETMPFKFLGRKIDHKGRTPSLETIVDNFVEDLEKVDHQPISNVKKAWIYDNYLTSRLTWPFLVYDFGKTLLAKLDKNVIKTLKTWLGLAHSADPSTLFRGQNSFGMRFKKPSELYKHLRVTKMSVLEKSKDDTVASLPKDKNLAELNSRLEFHKQFMTGSQSDRAGLGTRKKKKDQEVIKSFLQQDEVGVYQVHAMGLETQSDWLTMGDFCIPLALKWRTILYDWPPALLKFYLNAFQMTLPDQSNLVRWGKATDKTCNVCGQAIGTARHLLTGCKVLLDRGCYSRRHDRVLEVIREAVSLSVARAQRGLTTNSKIVHIVKEGNAK